MYRAYGKCTICDNWMKRPKAKESQWDDEDRNELWCDKCVKALAGDQPTTKTGHQLIAESFEAQALKNTFAPINELIAGFNAS